MEVEEIRRELQEGRRSHLEESEERLEHFRTMRDGEQKPNAASTTEEETEIQQQRNQIHKLKEKIESTCYQVTQIEIDKRPRLQKMQNMFKTKAITQMTNKKNGRNFRWKRSKYCCVKPPQLCSSNGYYRRNKWNRTV